MEKTPDVRVALYLHENEIRSDTSHQVSSRYLNAFSGGSRNAPGKSFRVYSLVVAEQRPRFGAGED
jgi:hypothetical protein